MKLINTIEEYEWLWGWCKRSRNVTLGRYHEKGFTKRKIIRMNPAEATILHFFCKKAKTRIVEIGTRYGGSTFVICNCSTVPVISIDKNYHENYVKKVKEQFESRLQIINKTSRDVNLQDKYDVLFVDGSHTFRGVRADIINYWNNLEINGYAIFHDYWSCSGVRRNVDPLIQNSIGKEITITEVATSQIKSIYDKAKLPTGLDFIQVESIDTHTGKKKMKTNQDIIVLQKIQNLTNNVYIS